MSIESGGFNPERKIVDYIKEQVKNSKVLELKGQKERNEAADSVLMSMGINGVDNLRDLLDKRGDKQINQAALGYKIDYLGMAVGEVIMESENEEMKQAVMAGSFSTEKFLPEAWRIRVEGDEGDQSLARVIVDGVISGKVSNANNRDLISNEMESVDYYKNNPQYGGLLAKQINVSMAKLESIKNPLKRKEMDFISEKLIYLQGVKDNMENGVDSASQDPLILAAEKMNQAAEKISKSAENKGVDPDMKKMLEKLMEGKWKTGHQARYNVPQEQYISGSSFDEGAEAKYYSPYDITAAALAVSMKVMDPDGARFDSYRPTKWYEGLPKEMQDAIDVMIEINGAAAATYYYGKELDKLVGSKRHFSFTSEKMRILFNDDFKLGMSKMLNDLCDENPDQNGYSSLNYKEKFYKLTEYRIEKINGIERKVPILGPGEKTENGFLMKSVGTNPDGSIIYRRVELDPKEEKNKGKGAIALDESVMTKLDFIEDYKEEIASFLAAQHGDEGFVKYTEDVDDHKKGEFILNNKGEKLPKPIYQMYAYTAWNLWYGMGDSSVADRMRMLPTWDKIVSDAIRTLNPEHKALGKMMIFKTGKPRSPEDLVEAEYFSGEIGDYVISLMAIEDKMGPIDGVKTMRQKILDGEVELFPDKMLYGFLDFFNGGRDLVKTETENGKEVKFFEKDTSRNDKVTLAQLLMNYGYKTVSGPNGKTEGVFNVADKKDFNFKKNQTTFMNEFRDHYEAAVLVNQALTGKLEAKDPGKWARQLKSAFGAVSQIWFNGKRVADNYTTSPWLWRSMMIGSFGADKSRLSSDYIPIKKPETGIKDYNQPYSFAVHDLIYKFDLNGVDKVKLMQLLGVDIKRGEHLRGEASHIRTFALETKDRLRTKNILKKLDRNLREKVSIDSINLDARVNKMASVYSADYNFLNLKRAYKRAIESQKDELAEMIVEKMEKLFRVS